MKVGFLGLGAMGLPMARNLHKHGLLTAAWSRTAGKATELATETGCIAPALPADVAALCDVVVSCVSADADVLDVITASLPGLKPGAIFIDCSTISADTARLAAQQLRQRGIEFLDAPVSGGVEGARNGTLAIMVGGDAATFEKALPALNAMGKTVTHFGPTGLGQAAKATNQLMCAGVIQACAEAMAFAKAEGLRALARGANQGLMLGAVQQRAVQRPIGHLAYGQIVLWGHRVSDVHFLPICTATVLVTHVTKSAGCVRFTEVTLCIKNV